MVEVRFYGKDTIKPHSYREQGGCPKFNVIWWIGFKHVYFDVVVQHVNHYATRTTIIFLDIYQANVIYVCQVPLIYRFVYLSLATII